jgi:hypothetical protein
MIAKLWANSLFLRPQDIDNFHGFILAEVVKVSVIEGPLLKEYIGLIKQRWNETLTSISGANWTPLKQMFSKLPHKPNNILKYYLYFLLEVLGKVHSFALREALISLDVLGVFEGLLVGSSENTRLLFCKLVHFILSSGSAPDLRYFLSKSSVLIRFYWMAENDGIVVKRVICTLFANLTDFRYGEVLLLFEEAKIVAVYFRLLQQHPELKEVCLAALIRVLAFAREMSLTTFNWFINHLNSVRAEEILSALKK